jgi:gliding motility-associated-like protein
MKSILLLLFLSLSFCFFSQKDKVWMHPNRGQWYEKINYKVDLNNGSMYIENNAFTYVFHNVGELRHHHEDEKSHFENDGLSLEDKIVQHTIKTTFLNSNSNHGIQEEKKSDFYRNYFLGKDENKWRSKIHAISELKYPNFYDGIDLLIEGKKEVLKYSFIVLPNVDASIIKYKIDGANDIKINKNGYLIVSHTYGEITESKPIAWTVDEKGNKTRVKVEFKLTNNQVEFFFPNEYNTNQTLIIDPEITFSTFTGSTVDNWGCTATPDLEGNLYAGGTVFGIGYPTTPGVIAGSYLGGENIGYSGFDIGLTKFNATGTNYMYSTYIGGNRNESPNSMITNDNGELYIMGITSSENFPTNGSSYQSSHNGGQEIEMQSGLGFSKTDIFIFRINATGTAYMNSTYVGGSGNDGANIGGVNGNLVFNYGDNFRGEIILDNAGNVIVASSTRSTDFPTVNASQNNLSGGQDAVLFKMTPNLSTMLWSTYYGGSGIDCGNAVAVNSLDEVYLVGGTLSQNLNVPLGHVGLFSGGSSDGFLTRFNGATGAVLSGTYVGTNDYDQCFFVQTDIDDFVYVYGQSDGIMPITAGLFGNITNRQFIRKYNPALSTVEWNTKIGGFNQRLSPTAFLVSNCYEIYIAGWGGINLGLENSNISNFPTTPDAFQTTSIDGDAFYLAVYEPNMANLKYATFMGGPAGDHVDGGTSRFDKSGRVYHAVCAACGGGQNGFITTPGVIGSTNNAGSGCNLAAFKFDLNSIRAIAAVPSFVICIPNPIQFLNNSIEGDTYFWDFGDGNTSTEENPEHVYLSVGNYTVKLVVSDSQGCIASDSTTIEISVGTFEAAQIPPPPTICKGAPYQFNATGGLNYLWSPSEFLDNPNVSNPTAIVFDTTTFSVIISDTCGIDTVFVTLNVFQDEISVSPDTAICLGNSIQIHVFGSESQIWTPDLFISNQSTASPIVNPDVTTTYYVNVISENNCEFLDSVQISVFQDIPIPIIDDTLSMCLGTNLDISVGGAPYYLWSPNQYINTIYGNQVIVSPPNDFLYYCEFINPCGSAIDSVFIDVIIPRINAYNDTVICGGESVVLSAEGAVSYQWSPVGTLNNEFLQYVTASPSVTTLYTVVGVDEFGCRDTATVYVQLFPSNPVFAGGSIYATIGENIQLNATTFGNIEGTYVWLPESFLSCSVCQSPIAQPNYNFTYNVIFIDTNGCRSTDLVSIYYNGVIYVPNTFTPDGSKFNEVFKAYGEGIHQFEMLIYNRWGELIKTLNSIDDYWDGRYKGQICQDGTYTWKLTYNDITGVFQTLTGHVNLIK